ncbi:PilZ domain-containing protein [Blastococcus sp. TML/M2B]|uniref:PilZ domain-containing protein n=1 Tax=unclassified Blastococcus TaxID=2619396 RepID=UPI00190E54C6|nr:MULTISPECIES: PilZ domain-containing protein [unclassified Blastococcus]MBN1094025.1 PilZ domain-containing protein [Blastococcus sp. TML/M2B]MBN1095858.1 PilZ domain-containing protein [Blastococcus sp. TML/C7B]
MLGEPGVDFPEEKTVLDVVATSRGDVLVSWVEEVRDDELIVSIPKDRAQRGVPMHNGERLELIWRGPEELRALPVELIDTQSAAGPCLRLRAVGPAGRGQRRAAVRAPLVLPIQVSRPTHSLRGNTLDLSEGGLRCLLHPANAEDHTSAVDAPPNEGPREDARDGASGLLEVGQVVDLTIGEADDELRGRGEVVRRHPRNDKLQEVSVRFIGLPVHLEDAIRRRVFANLREMRMRGLM